MSENNRSCGCLSRESITQIAKRMVRPPFRIDLTGRRFGRLVATGFAGTGKSGHKFWNCQCDCGNASVVGATWLTSGNTRSCGCALREARTTHGASKSSEYRIWASMLQRCSNPRNPAFSFNGGKGITVCQAWRDSYEAFIRDVGPRPGRKYSLDRIDPLGNYEPDNVRWALEDVQASNTTKTRYVTAFGIRRPVAEWAKRSNLGINTIISRLAAKWTPEDAVSKPSARNRGGEKPADNDDVVVLNGSSVSASTPRPTDRTAGWPPAWRRARGGYEWRPLRDFSNLARHAR